MKYRIVETDDGKFRVQYGILCFWQDSLFTDSTLEEAKKKIEILRNWDKPKIVKIHKVD